MPNLNQITDSINKSYVQLPDGSFAEKVVVVNSDGTAVSGGGGGTSSILVESPIDGSTVTVTLSAPTPGKVYSYTQQFTPGSNGTISFVPTLLAEQDAAALLGVIIDAQDGVYSIFGENSFNAVIPSYSFNNFEFVYAGQLTIEGPSTIAIYFIKQFVRRG